MLMAFSFLGLAISGIIMYIAPPCSVADRIGWTVMALGKDQWASMHQASALFVLILSLIHLFVYNWKTFMCYLRDRRSKRQAQRAFEESGTEAAKFSMPKELILALLVAGIMYAGAITFIAPFGWLHEGSDAIKEHYRKEVPSDRGRGLGTGGGDGLGVGLEINEIERADKTETVKSDTPSEIHREGTGLGTGRGDGAGQGTGLGTGRGDGAGQGRFRTQIESEVSRDTTG